MRRRQFIAVDNNINVAATQDLGQSFPLALRELRLHMEPFAERRHQLDFETDVLIEVVRRGIDEWPAAFSVTAPAKNAALTHCIQSIGVTKRKRCEKHASSQNDSSNLRDPPRLR